MNVTARVLLTWTTLLFIAPIDSLDHRLQRSIQWSRSAPLETPMRMASSGCNGTTLAGGLLAVALLGGGAGVITARTAVLALVPTNLAVESLKRLTVRTRPDGEKRRSNSSFPSSHAANAFALAVVLARRWRRAAVPLGVAAAVVGYSRLYLNRHFASDVLVGALIGAVCAWAVAGWAERRWRAGSRPSRA